MDPILSVVHEIKDQLGLKNELIERKFDKSKAVKEIAKLVGIINPTLSNFMIFLKSIFGIFKKFDHLLGIKAQKKLQKLINKDFDKMIKKKRLVVFIDELDRCKPYYAVDLLERIKRYLSNKNVIYVLSVNIYERQYTIKRFYGDGFNAIGYLYKFFDVTIDILQMNKKEYFNFIYPEVKNRVLQYICHNVIFGLNFSMRQIEHFVKMIKIFNIINYRCYYALDSFIVKIIAPFVIGVKMSNFEDYKKFTK